MHVRALAASSAITPGSASLLPASSAAAATGPSAMDSVPGDLATPALSSVAPLATLGRDAARSSVYGLGSGYVSGSSALPAQAMCALVVPVGAAYVEVTGSLMFGAGDVLEKAISDINVGQPIQVRSRCAVLQLRPMHAPCMGRQASGSHVTSARARMHMHGTSLWQQRRPGS